MCKIEKVGFRCKNGCVKYTNWCECSKVGNGRIYGYG